MKHVLVIEDNHIAAENIATLVRKVDAGISVHIAHNSDEAYAIAMKENLALMLVDISLDTSIPGDVSGIVFAKNIREVARYKFVPIIMITALEDPRMYAYSEIHCYSYIEKPIDKVKTLEIIKNALEYTPVTEKREQYTYKSDGILYSIKLSDVILIENKNRSINLYTVDEKINIPYTPLARMQEDLRNSDFIQCSRNHIVNKNYIEYVDGANRYIKIRGISKGVDIGMSFKKSILSRLI